MATIFTRIIKGEIPCYKIAETENSIAFLDINPLHKGHTLVVPKREVDDFFDLSETEIDEILHLSQKIAKTLKFVFSCRKVSVHVIGLEVPHAHLHLVPINSMSDCNFMNPKIKLSDDEMLEIQHLILKHLII